MEIGLLLLRVAIGGLMIGHGSQKLFGWFGGGGIAGTENMVGKLGFRPAKLWAVLAGLSETLGGLALILGFLSPFGSLGMVAAMVIAISVHRGRGLWATKGGYETPLLYLLPAVALAFTGPGTISLDHALGINMPLGLVLAAWIAMIAGILLAFASRPAANNAAAETRQAA